MTTETRRRLLDALESCQTIRRYVAGIDFAAYISDSKTRDAVESRLGIIGEALHHASAVDATLDEQLPELRQIVGLRNRIIHGYAAVNAEVVWDVVHNKLPVLETRLADLVEENPHY